VTRAARLGISLAVGFVAGLIAFFFGSWLPARAVAKGFIESIRDNRIDDAYARVRPGSRIEGEALERLRMGRELRYGGIVQLGFSDPFDWFSCFDAEMAEDARIWLVLRRKGSLWQVTELHATEPEMCKGGD
jgi:hypothetical protein